jgi:uncharacterized membrane protein YeaQ/YmgE (transglycosylase-associated protein family)
LPIKIGEAGLKVKGGVAMGLIWTLIVGLVAGALAKLAMPGRDPGGIGTTMALGVSGSLLATFFGRATHLFAAGGRAGIITSAIGAFVLLAIYRVILRRRETTHGSHGPTVRT